MSGSSLPHLDYSSPCVYFQVSLIIEYIYIKKETNEPMAGVEVAVESVAVIQQLTVECFCPSAVNSVQTPLGCSVWQVSAHVLVCRVSNSDVMWKQHQPKTLFTCWEGEVVIDRRPSLRFLFYHSKRPDCQSQSAADCPSTTSISVSSDN